MLGMLPALPGSHARAQLPAAAPGGAVIAPTPAATPTPLAWPVARVAEQAELAGRALRRIDEATTPHVDLEALEQSVSTFVAPIAGRGRETRSTLDDAPSPTRLENLDIEWQGLRRPLEDWRRDLDREGEQIEAALLELEDLRQRWTATVAALRGDAVPAALTAQTRTTLGNIGATADVVTRRRNRLLALQTRIATTRTTVEDALAEIGRARVALSGRLFVADSSALWQLARRAGPGPDLGHEIARGGHQAILSILKYLRANPGRLVSHVLLLLLLAAIFLAAKRRAAPTPGRHLDPEDPLQILQRPFSAALVSAVFATRVVHPDAPVAFRDLLHLVALVPLVRLLPRRGLFAARRQIAELAGLYAVALAADNLPQFSAAERLCLLGLAIVAAAWTWRARAILSVLDLSRGQRTSARGALWAAAGAFAGAVVANLVGNVSLARVACLWTLSALLFALAWAAGALLAHALVALALRSRILLALQSLRTHRLDVRALLFRWISLAACAGWLLTWLSLGPMLSIVRMRTLGLLSATWQIGNVHLSLGAVVTLGIGLWIVFRVATITRYVLEEDALPRLALPRGTPNAISILARYGIVLAGSFITLSAAGIDLANVAIVIGALSVGLGFGLQNVVNNFVSGLILLFERPIQPGDTVEIGSAVGTITRIGIRSSTLRSLNGAEVILPNADLVAGAVTNWTLSDNRRRVDITVGVAYGTDPRRVIEILQRIAGEHVDVLAEPPPMALFTGFGESSLDFELRVWLDAPTLFPLTRSELLLQTHDALAAAGIAIPFPQRDLHLTSVAPAVAATLGTGRPG